MNIQYLVTTRLEKVQELQEQGYAIVMVDGTVPGFIPRKGIDFHFDHHRPNGGNIQLDELPYWNVWLQNSSRKKNYNAITSDCVIVTTQVDADACVAAAALFMMSEYGELWAMEQVLTHKVSENWLVYDWPQKLEAIAWDCDHLYVPSFGQGEYYGEDLSKYADFAAQAVAAMKENSNSLVSELGLNPNRREWSIEDKERFASEAFKQGVQCLVNACFGFSPFPGEQGEAQSYWEKVEANTKMLAEQGRVSLYRDAVIIDMKGLGGQYIDPRCPLRVVKQWDEQPKTPVTITQREIYVENEFKGYSYTIGCIPWHFQLSELDYCKGVFDALTDAETKKGGDPQINKWGGRKTVGGSGWNAVSLLSPHEVIEVVLNAISPTAPIAEVNA